MPPAPSNPIGAKTMSQETVQQNPALTASQSSWRCVHAKDKEGWLALMADDVVIEDPIGRPVPTPTVPACGEGSRPAFWDDSIGLNHLRSPARRPFPSSSPDEIAHILVLRIRFPQWLHQAPFVASSPTVDDAGLLTNLRGYWNMDMHAARPGGRSRLATAGRPRGSRRRRVPRHRVGGGRTVCCPGRRRGGQRP